jgi:isoleucyl-tRNA synthetase
MGHAVNKVLKDITLKHHIANQRRVHYKPGWDCHGLPIELKATKDADKLYSIEIRTKARKFALATLEKQKAEFETWGVTADWQGPENIYRTLDVAYVKQQIQLFHELYQKGLIYRDMKPVYWSPSSRTALAEAELEYDANYESQSLYLRMGLTKFSDRIEQLAGNKSVFAIIWTTTPWSLPANQAICYNNDLNYSMVQLEDDSNSVYIVATDLVKQLSEELNKNLEQLAEFKGLFVKLFLINFCFDLYF